MESKQNLEVIQEAINQLLEEEEINEVDLTSSEGLENENSGGSHRHRRSMLFQLRSQLESLEQENGGPEKSNEEANVEETTLPSPSHIDGHITTHNCSENNEIIKELKHIKRQNLITHCLLSAMIVITLTWQLSEVSLILKIKRVLSSPLDSLGGIVTRFLKDQPKVNVQEVMKQAASIKEINPFESASLPVLKIPDLLQLELPGFDTSEEE